MDARRNRLRSKTGRDDEGRKEPPRRAPAQVELEPHLEEVCDMATD